MFNSIYIHYQLRVKFDFYDCLIFIKYHEFMDVGVHILLKASQILSFIIILFLCKVFIIWKLQLLNILMLKF